MNSSNQPNPEATTKVVRHNIDTIAKLEREYLQEQPLSVKWGHLIAQYSGTFTFALLNILVYAVWVLANLGFIPGVQRFDPFPFNLLTLLVSFEAIILAIIILMSQTNLRLRDEQRQQLSLQISLLIEKEITEMFQMQQEAFKRLNALDETSSQESEQLREPKHVETVVEEVEKKIPQQGQ